LFTLLKLLLLASNFLCFGNEAFLNRLNLSHHVEGRRICCLKLAPTMDVHRFFNFLRKSLDFETRLGEFSSQIVNFSSEVSNRIVLSTIGLDIVHQCSYLFFLGLDFDDSVYFH